MFLGIDGEYSAFEELMHYYHFDFKVYYILFIIVLVNCIKSLINYISFKKRKVLNNYSNIIDLFISVLAGIGLCYGMIFQGVLSDISNKYFRIWGNKLFVLCVVSLISFIIQFILTFKVRDKS
jgi:hypothetical protein